MNNIAIITLEKGSTVTVVRGGVKVAFNANVGINVYGNVPVTVHPPANDRTATTKNAEPLPGDKMEDGTIFAGVSPDTGEYLFAMWKDAPRPLEWDLAKNHVEHLNINGHEDWRLPTKAELNVLFNNRANIGNFNESDDNFAGWYWSSEKHPNPSFGAWAQGFSDGAIVGDKRKRIVASVRPVRSEPRFASQT